MYVLGMVKELILSVIETERRAPGNFLQHKYAIGEFFYELLAYCINMPGDEPVSAEYLKSCSEQQRPQAARVVLEANREGLWELLGIVPGWVKKVGVVRELIG